MILGREHLQLLGDAVGVLVAHLPLKPDDAFTQQPLVEHVAEAAHAAAGCTEIGGAHAAHQLPVDVEN